MSKIHSGRPAFDLSLYLIANRPSFGDEVFFSKVQRAVQGGVSCVQYRDHKSDLSEAIKTAQRLKEMLKGVPLFINTRRSFDVIRSVGAEGIFFEDPFPLAKARKELGERAIIGISVRTVDDVRALGDEADYISVKVGLSKKTSPLNNQIWGMDGLRLVRAMTSLRIVAIGGLRLPGIASVFQELKAGDGVAVAGGIMDEVAPEQAAHKIQAIWKKIREER